MIENIKDDILKIYDYMIENNEIKKMGYPDHDKFQEYLTLLAQRYNLTYKTEYVGKTFYDPEKHKYYKGRIDIVYYKNNKPYVALEIDCGLKGTSIKKLLANNKFKYRIWFCYNRKAGSKEYYDLIDRIDKNKELIYIARNKWKIKRNR